MKRYIGLDVHAASCTLAVISESGKRLKDFPVETNGQALVEAVRLHPRREAPGLRGGSAERLALRDAEPTCRRDCGGWDQAESGEQGRQERLLRPGRGLASWVAEEAGLQGTTGVHSASRAVSHTHDGQSRSSPGAGSHQEPVSVQGHSYAGDRGLQRSTARGVEQAASGERREASRLFVRSARLLHRAEEGGGGRSRSGGEEAPRRSHSGNSSWLWPHPLSSARLNRGDTPSVSNEATILELLRSRDCDALQLRLGTDRRRRLGSSSRAEDAGTFPAAQPGTEGHLQGRRHHSRDAGEQRSALRSLRANARWGYQTNAREALTGAHHRSNSVANVERRRGIQAKLVSLADRDRPQRVGDGSVLGEREHKVAIKRWRENGSEVSIQECSGPRCEPRRPQFQAMPLRRTKGSYGRNRPRWKDGSHIHAENTKAEESRRRATVYRVTTKCEPLVGFLLMLLRDHEGYELTRGRPANARADVRIEEFGANRGVCLAPLPYGRTF